MKIELVSIGQNINLETGDMEDYFNLRLPNGQILVVKVDAEATAAVINAISDAEAEPKTELVPVPAPQPQQIVQAQIDPANIIAQKINQTVQHAVQTGAAMGPAVAVQAVHFEVRQRPQFVGSDANGYPIVILPADYVDPGEVTDIWGDDDLGVGQF